MKYTWRLYVVALLSSYFCVILDFTHGTEGEFPGDNVEERDALDEEEVSTEGNFAMVVLDGLE